MAYRFTCPVFIHDRICHVWPTGCEPTLLSAADLPDHIHMDSQRGRDPASIADSHNDTHPNTDARTSRDSS